MLLCAAKSMENGGWLMIVHVACFATWNVYYVMIRAYGASRFLSYQQAY